MLKFDMAQINIAHNVETFEADDGTRHIVGYGALYYDGTPTTEYNIADKYITRFLPGSFSEDRFDDVRAFFNHNPDHVLGRVSAGTLKLELDGRGLKYDITVPDTQSGRDVLTSVHRGDITGASVTIAPAEKGTKQFKDGERYVREFTAVILFEVGPVTIPAFSNTSAIAADADSMGVDDYVAAIDAEQSYRDYEYRLRKIDIQKKSLQ